MTDNTFTYEYAYQIQQEGLDRWRRVLHPDAYIMLLHKVMESNKKGYTSPYQVVRGSSLDNFIHEIMREIQAEEGNN